MKYPRPFLFAFIIACLGFSAACARADNKPVEITPALMQSIYDEVKTPYKYGVVIPAPKGTAVDCPNVFRHGGRWFMVYVQLEPKPAQGYTTQLAVSDDLVNWQPVGTIMPQGKEDSWDRANAGGGVALMSTQWDGDNALGTHAGRYWMSYIGGAKYGYESIPLHIGLASINNPAAPVAWEREHAPILKTTDADVRPFETDTLYKSFIFRDSTRTLGAEFVMYYNARPPKGDERIGMAISDDMKTWRRYGKEPVLGHDRPPALKWGTITGDPQIVRTKNVWVMFYFGAFYKPKAFDTFAVSTDLVHWKDWEGEDLIKPSEPYDKDFAHKPWIIKHDGVVYHFYCAVGEQGRVIALATSKPIKKETVNETAMGEKK